MMRKRVLLLLIGFGVCLAVVNLGDWLKEE